jgi:hypothetical protein
MIVGATPMCMGKICCNFIMWSLLNYCSMDKIFVEEILFLIGGNLIIIWLMK